MSLEYHPVMLGEILTAIVTPFHADGSVDYDRFRELAQHLVEHGSDGLVVTGTTGESPTLTDDERFELYAAAVDAVGDHATVVAGTGTYSTAHSVHLTARAHELGVHGFLVVTPYYNKPPARGIVEHFRAIAEVSDRPIIAYNIPARVVVNIEPETIAELAEIPTVTAVKQANDDLDQARRIVELGLDLYAGDDNLIYPFIQLGAVGGVCVHTHVWGPQTKEMVRAYKDGDAAAARRLNDEMQPAFDLLGITTNPIPIKAALNLLGLDVGGHRLPLVPPTDDELGRVRDCLERAGLQVPAAA
jgi:4-hydroxy-tetrahydrodipicolinate synthase